MGMVVDESLSAVSSRSSSLCGDDSQCESESILSEYESAIQLVTSALRDYDAHDRAVTGRKGEFSACVRWKELFTAELVRAISCGDYSGFFDELKRISNRHSVRPIDCVSACAGNELVTVAEPAAQSQLKIGALLSRQRDRIEFSVGLLDASSQRSLVVKGKFGVQLQSQSLSQSSWQQSSADLVVGRPSQLGTAYSLTADGSSGLSKSCCFLLQCPDSVHCVEYEPTVFRFASAAAHAVVTGELQGIAPICDCEESLLLELPLQRADNVVHERESRVRRRLYEWVSMSRQPEVVFAAHSQASLPLPSLSKLEVMKLANSFSSMPLGDHVALCSGSTLAKVHTLEHLAAAQLRLSPLQAHKLLSLLDSWRRDGVSVQLLC